MTTWGKWGEVPFWAGDFFRTSNWAIPVESRPLHKTQGAGHPVFKGGTPRLSPAWDFLPTPAAPSLIECADDRHHPPLRKVREKDGAVASFSGLR